MIESTWSKTYRRDSIPGLDEVAVVTGVLTNLPPGNKLVSDLTLRTLTGTVDVRIEVPLTPPRCALCQRS